MNVVFRADSGPSSGLGHVHRCLALAAALAERGACCSFDVTHAADRVVASGFALVDKPVGPDDIVVVDSYGIDSAYLRALRDEGHRVVLVDDHAAFPVPSEVCVNAGANADQLSYVAERGDTQFLLGPSYALLPPELWDVEPRPPAPTVGNVVLTLGGSDPHGLAPLLLDSLDALDEDFALTLAVGPYFAGRAELARPRRHDVRLLDAPLSLVEAMQEADLAVSAAGQTLYALARLGTPTVAIEIAANQRGGLAALAASGAVRVAENGDLPTAVAGAVRDLLHDAPARHALGHAASALLDGQGARRVAAAVFDRMEER